MSHEVTVADVRSMRVGVSTLNEKVDKWSEMIGHIRGCRAYLPQTKEDFTLGAKDDLTFKLRTALNLAKEITVDADDMSGCIQSLLDTVQTTDVYEAPEIEPPKTVQPPENANTITWRVVRRWSDYMHGAGDSQDNFVEEISSDGKQRRTWKNDKLQSARLDTGVLLRQLAETVTG